MIRLCSTPQCWVRSCHLSPQGQTCSRSSLSHLQHYRDSSGMPLQCSSLVTGSYLECFKNGAVVFYPTDTSLLSLFFGGHGTREWNRRSIWMHCQCSHTQQWSIQFPCVPMRTCYIYMLPWTFGQKQCIQNKQMSFPQHSVSHQYSEAHYIDWWLLFLTVFYSVYLLCLKRNVSCKYSKMVSLFTYLS